MSDIKYFSNPGGPDIGTASGKVIEQDGKYFRDLEGTGELLPYEDWRLPAKERAQDLAQRLSIEEIAGLMMYSPHQMVPAAGGPFAGTYGGKSYAESGAAPSDLTDQQQDFLKNNHIRYVLAVAYESVAAAVDWNNKMQAFAEAMPHGIPVNFSSDPRNGVKDLSTAEFKTTGANVSQWPEGLGMSALFSPERCKEYAGMISREYRALGISTALSPQADLGSEPRWMRTEDTFGPCPELVRDMVQAYCDGMQTTCMQTTCAQAGDASAKETADADIPGGAAASSPYGAWGRQSVSAMVKHWPGGGPMESGRDAHYPYGAYAVYPGDNLKDHLQPFLEGAFSLQDGTQKAAAVMPYYSVSWEQDQKDHLNVGNSYSHYLINDLLREQYGYDGVVCTDWGITGDPIPEMDSFGPRCYGVQDLTEAERHLRLIENGVDQFGGNFNMQPILEAYRIGCEKYGEEAMRERMERSAVRLLVNSFRCGLFENPYLTREESEAVVGCDAFTKAGYQAQVDSVVLVKNAAAALVSSAGAPEEGIAEGAAAGAPVLPVRDRKKVYIPVRHIVPGKTFFRTPGGDPYDLDPAEGSGLEEYYDRTASPEEADFAVVFIESPRSEGYMKEDRETGGNGYLPISLQYRPYRADTAREISIAGGDFREDFTNRTYRGKEAHIYNECDLDSVIETKKAMGDKPVIVVIRMHLPCVLAELEPYADAILVEFGVSRKALYDLISGREVPSGLLPVQLPADMETVEQHCEDVPLDLKPYVDSAGNAYDFGFGLNFDGVIRDGRADRYKR